MWQHAKTPDPTHIAADEKSYKKGRKYVTVDFDVERGMVIWVSEGNTKSSLDEFFKILRPEICKKIQSVSKDRATSKSNLEYHQTGRSSSFSEAINRKINVIIGMAHGYHCLEYLKLKILQRCGAIGKYWKPELGAIIPV